MTPAPDINFAPFFWLHLKKCGGGSVREMLRPSYVETQRKGYPANFIQSDPSEWNDILNNYRVPLGAYQFRRALFAKRFLYKDHWDNLLRFAITREPVERAVSAFFHLRKPGHSSPTFSFVEVLAAKDPDSLPDSESALFDLFLRLIEQSISSKSIYSPINPRFAMHVAPVWSDVTGSDGENLLSHIFRLEDLEKALKHVFRECDLEWTFQDVVPLVHARTPGATFTPNRAQRAKIEAIYAKDFDVFENALRV